MQARRGEIMTNFNGYRRLWGHDFRVVANGLDETDVAAFVDGVLTEYQSSIERSKHVEPLHELGESRPLTSSRTGCNSVFTRMRRSSRSACSKYSRASRARCLPPA